MSREVVATLRKVPTVRFQNRGPMEPCLDFFEADPDSLSLAKLLEGTSFSSIGLSVAMLTKEVVTGASSPFVARNCDISN